jgi:methylmalonyl-CoA mutase
MTKPDKIRAWTLANVRGTVQADILKEDQGQNTCIFSTEFSLKVMGDIAEYFVHHDVRNFYSVSISGLSHRRSGRQPHQPAGLHAEQWLHVCGSVPGARHAHRRLRAQPELLLQQRHGPGVHRAGPRGAPHLGHGHADRYGANERSQKLKYHIQTSGRSLHAQEIQFNDIRTTLQALIAVYDNCNSLHTNAYDEAITTPTEESVRRAMAIQLIINREWGLAKNENPNQGAFIIDELTELVEEAVLSEFEKIAERGGVLGAMETGYQRSKIQEESMHYEMLKHTGEYPIIGVNTFRNPQPATPCPQQH